MGAPKWLPRDIKVPQSAPPSSHIYPSHLPSQAFRCRIGSDKALKSLHSPKITAKWPPNDPRSIPKWPEQFIKSLKFTPSCLQFDILKHKNVRIPSNRASQKLSRRSFGSKLNFVMSILYFYMDFHGFPWISVDFRGFPWVPVDLNTKTVECRATRHEIKNF